MSTDRFYHGKPCVCCGFTERYRTSRECAHCKRLRDKKRKPRAAEYWQLMHLRRNYGITLLEYREMLERQGGGCAICGTKTCVTGNRFAVDHCHRTDRLRGLLCQACNTGLGKLRDDPATLRAAAEYLERVA